MLSLLLRIGSIPTLHLKILNNFSGQRFDGKIQEKRSGKRNRDIFATVLFLFRSVTPIPSSSEKTWPNHFISISLALVTLSAVLSR